jgi:hypothetical protein
LIMRVSHALLNMVVVKRWLALWSRNLFPGSQVRFRSYRQQVHTAC